MRASLRYKIHIPSGPAVPATPAARRPAASTTERMPLAMCIRNQHQKESQTRPGVQSSGCQRALNLLRAASPWPPNLVLPFVACRFRICGWMRSITVNSFEKWARKNFEQAKLRWNDIRFQIFKDRQFPFFLLFSASFFISPLRGPLPQPSLLTTLNIPPTTTEKMPHMALQRLLLCICDPNMTSCHSYQNVFL